MITLLLQAVVAVDITGTCVYKQEKKNDAKSEWEKARTKNTRQSGRSDCEKKNMVTLLLQANIKWQKKIVSWKMNNSRAAVDVNMNRLNKTEWWRDRWNKRQTRKKKDKNLERVKIKQVKIPSCESSETSVKQGTKMFKKEQVTTHNGETSIRWNP